jgi:hypothetical protein
VVTDELVDRALAILADGAANYHYFFANLKSPDWIAPLKRRGRFSNPPPAEIRGDSMRFPPWPEGEYLLRMAPQSPQEVFEAINEKWHQSDNHSVHDLILRIATELPSAFAAQMAEAEAKWASRQGRFYILYAHRSEPLLVKLARDNQTLAALKLLDPILEVRAPESGNAQGEVTLGESRVRLSVNPVGRVDPWHVQRLTSSVGNELAQREPDQTLALLSQKLHKAVEIHQNDRKSDNDFSTIWRPQIAVGHLGQLLDVLVTAVRDVGLFIASSSDNGYETVVRVFEKQKWPIFRRLEYYVLSETRTLPQAFASRLLLRSELYSETTANPEFNQFLSKWAPKVPDEIRREIFATVVSGPDLSRYSRFLEEQESKGARSEAEQWISDKWRLGWLTALDEVLDEERRAALRTLTEKYGQPQPTQLISGFRAASEVSALSLEEIKKLSISDLVAYLRNWQPTPGWNPDKPNRAGLGSTLQQWAQEDPRLFSDNLKLFEDANLHPTYLRSVIDAFCEVLKGDAAFDVYSVATTIEWLLRNTTVAASGEQDWDEDPGWSWAHMSSARFLSELFLHTQRLDIRRCREFWPAVELIAQSPSPSPEDEKQYGEGSDFGIAALNNIRSVGVQAAMQYARWIKSSDSTGDASGPARALDLLAKRLDPTTDTSVAVREMFGMHFNLLAWLDRKWLEQNLPALFPKEPRILDRFAWNSYVRFSRPLADMLPAMRFRYVRAINALQPNAKSVDDSDRALGNHLIGYYASQAIELDDPLLTSFFTKGSPPLRAQTIGDIGWHLREDQSGSLPVQLQERLMNLWQDRLAKASKGRGDEAQRELASFGWWLASKKFPDSWAVQQTVAVLDAFRKIEPDFAVVERLADLAPTYAFEAVHSLGIIFEEDREGWAIHGWGENPQAIIREALRFDERSRHEAERVVNLFVARGHAGFRSLLKPGQLGTIAEHL